MLSRRHFLAVTTTTLAATVLRGQSARINVADVERDRILSDAKQSISPATLRDLSASIATLTAAFVLTKDDAYAKRAAPHLAAIARRNPQPPDATTTDLVPLAEVAVAIRFLVDAIDLTTINTWLTTLQTFLTEDRTLRIARDVKDHRASAWLLLSSAIARSQRDEKTLAECRHHLRTPTLRNQLTADGHFPQELATPNPYRNSLFNFDLLAGTCQILASPFDDLWNYELQDGPGMRSAAAFLYPFIQDRGKWPGVSDAQHFHELPGRRPALLFTGRAYNRPEYVSLWNTIPEVIPAEVAASFPIRQPLLWTARAAHGL